MRGRRDRSRRTGGELNVELASKLADAERRASSPRLYAAERDRAKRLQQQADALGDEVEATRKACAVAEGLAAGQGGARGDRGWRRQREGSTMARRRWRRRW